MNEFIESVFGQHGWLVSNGFSYNPLQREYAEAIAHSVTVGSGSVCPIEADTGVGKTLAYLMVLANVASLRRVIISTHSISLLRQIQKELLTVKKCFSDLKIAFPMECIRLGREHYVNPDKLINLINERLLSSNREQMNEVEQMLVQWASRTVRSGDGLISGWVDEYGPLPEWIVESQICCNAIDNEFNNPAMEQTHLLATSSYFVITSHAMLVNHCLTQSLGDLSSAILLVDEADKFEDAAALILNQRVQLNATSRLVDQFELAASNLTKLKNVKKIRAKLKSIDECIAPHLSHEQPLLFLSKLPVSVVEQLRSDVNELGGLLEGLAAIDLPIKEGPLGIDTRPLEIQNEIKLISSLMLDYSKSIYKRGIGCSEVHHFTSLFTNHPKPASIIQRLLKGHPAVAIFTSATLTNSNFVSTHSFSYLASSILIKESDFKTDFSFTPDNFGEVSFVLSDAKKIGKPYLSDGEFNPRWLDNCIHMISHAASEHERVLVLCNSYSEISMLEYKMQNMDLPILYFNRNSSLADLLSCWISSKGVLVAANLWEGFSPRMPDGSQLFTALVMTKLPFSPINQFDLEALTQHHIELGRSGNLAVNEYFQTLNVKSARKFKQGFGRLIRRASDKGVFYIADPRFSLQNKKYASFIGAIPKRYQLQSSSSVFSNGILEAPVKTMWIEGLL